MVRINAARIQSEAYHTIDQHFSLPSARNKLHGAEAISPFIRNNHIVWHREKRRRISAVRYIKKELPRTGTAASADLSAC